MKTKFWCGITITAIVAITAFNMNLRANNGDITSLAFANAEALAQEEGSAVNKGEPTERTETKTITTKKTDESGWSWSVGLNVWLFNGSVSKKSPTSSWEETTTTTNKYTCCQSGIDKPCNHITCP